jgi:hypothetical protein
LAKSRLRIYGRSRHPEISFLQKTARTEIGSLWLPGLSISVLSSRKGGKTEIHSMIGAVDLMDFPDPLGIEQLRHCDDNNDQKTEQ